MKVRFHEHEQAKPQVRQDQEDTKQTRFKRKPYWLIFVVLFLVVGLVYAGYQLIDDWSIRTRGEVVAAEVTHSALHESLVTKLLVKRGSFVKQDDLIAVLQPVFDQASLDALVAELEGLEDQKQALADAAVSTDNSLQASLENQRLSAEKRVADLETVLLNYQAELLRRRWSRAKGIEDQLGEIDDAFTVLQQRMMDNAQVVEQSELDLEKYKVVESRLQKRLADIETLFALDAATKEQLGVARSELELASLDVIKEQENLAYLKVRASKLKKQGQAIGQSRVAYQQASSAEEKAIRSEEDAQKSSYAEQIKRAKSNLEALNNKAVDADSSAEDQRVLALKELDTRIKSLKARIEAYKTLKSPVEVKAEVDGVVTGLPTGEGVVLAAGEAVVSIARADSMYITCYVDDGQAEFIKKDAKVRLYSHMFDEAIQGTISGPSQLAARAPSILREQQNSNKSQLLVVIDLPEGSKLVPGEVVRVVIPK